VTWSCGSPGRKWSPGGVESGGRRFGARDLERHAVDIASGDIPIR
jgi:hypothetical protein